MVGSVSSSADPARTGASSPTSASAAITHAMNECMPSSLPLIGEWPEPKVVLQRLPEPGEPERLDDEKEEDQAAEDHELGVRADVRRHEAAGETADGDHRGADRDGQQHDEGGAEVRAEEGAHAADDDHAEDPDRDWERVLLDVGRLVEAGRDQRAGGAPVERADHECEHLVRQEPDAHVLTALL